MSTIGNFKANITIIEFVCLNMAHFATLNSELFGRKVEINFTDKSTTKSKWTRKPT